MIRRHGLASGAGLDLQVSEFASPDAGKLALNGGSVDLAVVDWLWVARARALGAKWLFYPYSSAVGAVMVKSDSPLRKIADLKGRVLAVAGGPLDKSWLIVQAAALRQGIDLKREATLEYGAPPLIFQKSRQGEAEASLNFWNFCARLEAQGFRSNARRARCRGSTRAEATRRADRLRVFRAVRERATGARSTASSPSRKRPTTFCCDPMQEWDALRPLMKAQDESTFTAYRDRTREGMPRRTVAAEAAEAARAVQDLARIGGPELVGPLQELDQGLYYQPAPRGD